MNNKQLMLSRRSKEQRRQSRSFSNHDEDASIDIPLMTVGDIDNRVDRNSGYGSVSYEYQIGKYGVTNGQYAAFLNAVDSTSANTHQLCNSNMSSEQNGGITRNINSSYYESSVPSALN